jgi:hypothetical protein
MSASKLAAAMALALLALGMPHAWGQSSPLDGAYAGTTQLTESGRAANCPSGGRLQMTITAGKVVVHTFGLTGQPGIIYSGTVGASGAVKVSGQLRRTGEYRSAAGRIQGGAFTGESTGRYCNYAWTMAKQ